MNTSKRGSKSTAFRCALTCGAAVGALLIGNAPAFAQEGGVETVYVTGYRASLEKSLDIKRASTEMVDAISAEDVGKFPDANLAESLQRLPGVAVDRDNGEGRTITVRGLNADFTRVTVNGLEALSTSGSSQSGDDPNRSRQFDFNTFASELFSGLKVHKSQAADVDEGSLGATVELTTGRPFDVGDKSVISLQNAWYEQGKPFNPRVSGLYSKTFLGGRLGFLVSTAYNMRHQMLDGYQRQAGQSDYLYRQTYFYGPANGTDTVGASVKNASNKAIYFPTRFGFSAPAGTACNAASVDDVTSLIPGQNVANSDVCGAFVGSNSAAYNTVTKNTAGVSSGLMGMDKSFKGYYAGAGVLDRDQPFLTMIPSLTALNKRELYQSRLGNTASVEWQPTDHTLIVADALYAATYQNSTNYQVGLIGTNRGNQTQKLMKVTSTANPGYKQSVIDAVKENGYYKCSPSSGKDGYADVACNSGDLYSYYAGTGAAENPTAALKNLLSFVGKPTTKVAKATVSNNQATYLQLANIDLRSAADMARYTTEFMQGTVRAEEQFSQNLKADLTIGYSQSRNKQVGILAEFNRMDAGTYDASTNTCAGCFTYDATGGGEMPSMEFGTDTAGNTVGDAGYWNIVKGFSAMRHYIWGTTNKFRTVAANVQYTASDKIDLKAGFTARIFDFSTYKATRVMPDTYNLGLDQINAAAGTNYTIADLGQRMTFGSGLEVPSGTTSAIYVPNLDRFAAIYGLGTNSVKTFAPGVEQNNISSNLYTQNAGSAYSSTFQVGEHDKAYYAQADFHNIMLLDRELRGNIGMRFVTTEITSNGRSLLPGIMMTAHNSYNDFLPSANLAYSLNDDMQLRVAVSKVMARPQLAAMSPSISSMSIPTTEPFQNGTATMGNPKLKPFRANTFDASYEWYFSEGSAISVAVFSKWIKGIIQQVTTPGIPVGQIISSDTRTALAAYYNTLAAPNGPNQAKFISDDSNALDVTRYENTGNGALNGIEITWQQQLKFLPHPFDGFGLNANYTLLHSKMNYLIQPALISNGTVTKSAVYGPGPWVGASPIAWNVTVFYDGMDWSDRPWSARISGAYRSKFAYKYPIATGNANPGYSDSPVVNDYIYTQSTLNLDASFSWDYTDWMQFRIDALNLTNQTDSRMAYSNMADPAVAYYAATGRQVFAGVRMKF